jgi:predicted GNAT family N-acyltransferase
MSKSAAWPEAIEIAEAPYCSELYRRSVALREAVLRAPLGLELTEAELADDEERRHFCATLGGDVVGTVSLQTLDGETLQLRQMAVAENRRRERIGARLLARAEDWARREGYRSIVLHARLGAEAFYAKHGYVAEGAPFDEQTIPHISMTKRLRDQAASSEGKANER